VFSSQCFHEDLHCRNWTDCPDFFISSQFQFPGQLGPFVFSFLVRPSLSIGQKFHPLLNIS
jgi:hypothetical protein